MPIATCAITGDVKSLLNASVENCEIIVSVNTPFFHGDTWISGQLASVLTNASGSFSVSVIETETVSQNVTFTFRYFDGSANRKLKKYTAVVPNTATAFLADIITSSLSPITAPTFPASSVTVSSITNLAATTAQTAFAEHQIDIDTLNTAVAAGSTALATHIADTTTHGTTGDIVGTSDSQTLTNKTIDGDSNTILDIGITSLKTDLAAASTFISRNASGVVISTKIVPSGTVVGTSDAQVLTAKTLDGDDNTVQDLPLTAIKTVLTDAGKFLARDASGIPVSVNTVPASAVVGISESQTLTNKTISGASNTITNVSLTTGVNGTLPLANGGTNATTKAGAFDSLSPMTTAGDIIYGGTAGTGTRLGVGSNGQVLTLASGLPSWAPSTSGAELTAIIKYARTGTASHSTTSTSFADLSGTSVTPSLVYNSGNGGTWSVAASTAPQITSTSMPAVTYTLVTVTFTASNRGGGTSYQSYRLTDGTTVGSTIGVSFDGAPGGEKQCVTLSGVFVYGSSGTRTFKIQALVTAQTAYVDMSATDGGDMFWKVETKY